MVVGVSRTQKLALTRHFASLALSGELEPSRCRGAGKQTLLDDGMDAPVAVDPLALAASVEDGPRNQANPSAQENMVGTISKMPLLKKAPAPTRPPVREKIVGPFSQYRSVNNPIAKPNVNSIKDIEAELAEVRKAWQKYQTAKKRVGVYFYLTAVFDLVRRWQRLNCSLKKSQAALRLKPHAPKMKPEPFSRVIFCTCDSDVADAKTRSKWSRALRYARKAKPSNQRLTDFIKSNGGINACAGMFARNK